MLVNRTIDSTQATAQSYSIKEASNLTGLPASTLRYYEAIGIIQPIRRDSSSKQRVYSDEDLDALTSVACLHATGMNISDMRAYMSNSRRGPESAGDQIALLSSQKRHLAEEATLLKVRQQYVDLKINYWRAVTAGDEVKAQDIATEARKLADILKPAA
jgi:DNA-binding transcriptional MerR regulator